MSKTIADVDRNFKVETTIQKEDLVFYDVRQQPFAVHGVYHEDGRFRRLPEAVAAATSDGVHFLHTNTAGGRVRFRTDSPYVAIHTVMPFIGKMPHFALTGSAGFDLYIDNHFRATFQPPFDIEHGYDSVIDLGERVTREITIHFPLYSDVAILAVGLADTATLDAPAPYATDKPIVYYGSSITQGGCASRPGNAYENILSRRLSCDHINLGFSGCACGEEPILRHIASLDMAAFVYDYDYNAPTVAHLRDTHERGFRLVREAHPTLPIVMMSRPAKELCPEERERLVIVKATHDNARASGDENVYFLPGPLLTTLCGDEGTVDGCHPTDFGFASMAAALEPILRAIMEG